MGNDKGVQSSHTSDDQEKGVGSADTPDLDAEDGGRLTRPIGAEGAQNVSTPTVEIIDVSPELAETWLSRNTSNRNVRQAVVDAYSRDMTSESWLLNGETVKFDAEGNLRDGQHRLLGIIKSGQTVPIVVVRGLVGDIMPTIDAGTKRTYADALRIAGEENTATLAAVTRRALLWHRGYRTKIGSVYPTPLEMRDFLATQPELRTAADIATRLASKAMVPASVFGLAYWLLSKLDTDDATWFLARVADGDGLSSDDPIAAYRARIVRMRVGGGRVNETEALALLILAWNAHRAGERRLKLQMPKGGLTNENFPSPY